MLITLITAAYNSASTIADTFKSVKCQTYNDYEHIVIDGKSMDKTVDIARGMGDHRTVIRSERDGGIYDAMNKGILLARGDVIGFLNSDDMLADRHVLARVAAAFGDRHVLACYGDLNYVDEKQPQLVRRRWVSGAPSSSSLSLGWIPPHPTFYCRRSVYSRLGGFDLQWRLAADHELLTRYIVSIGDRLRYIPIVMVNMRLGGVTNRSIKNIVCQNYEIVRSLARHRLGPSPLLPLWKAMDRLRQRRSLERS